MRDVVIAQYLRTAQSRSRPQDPGRDWFHKLRSDDMLARLLPEVLDRAGLEAADVDDLIVGTAQGVLEQSTMGGRSPMLLANLDKRTSAICLRLNGRVRELGQPYGSYRGRPIVRPPAIPNCRSRVVPWHEDWATG